MKVFGIGAHKTGTTSLEWVLERTLRLRPLAAFPHGAHLIPNWTQGDFDTIIKFARPFRSLSDSPWNHGDLYQKLDAAYPDSKFILTVRESRSWFDSLYRHATPIHLLPYGPEFHHYEYGLPFGEPFTRDHEQQYIEIYEARNQAVKDYFRDQPDSLLVIDWTQDGVKKVGDFLGIEVKDIPAPHLNKGKPAI